MIDFLPLVLFALVCIFLLFGFPVAFTLAGVSIIFALITSFFGVFDLFLLETLPNRIFGVMTNSTLIAVPLFIFMGVLLEKSKVAEELLLKMSYFFSGFRGGLGLSVIFVGALLAASTGIVGATVIAMGLISLPAFLKQGYPHDLSTGLISATGTLGQIIPPSIALVILGDVLSSAYQQSQLSQGIFTAKTISVGDLFISAMLPGLMLGSMLFVFVLLVGEWARVGETITETEPPAKEECQKAILKGLPMFCFPLVILGGIYGGIFTPTEAAAVSVVLALLLSLTVYRAAGLSDHVSILVQSGTMAATILIIMAATSVLSYILSYEQIPKAVTELITHSEITPFVFILLVNILLLGLGCFLEIISVILIVVPMLLPTLNDLGINPVYFGIILIVNMELAVITPPIGMNLFVVSAISRQSISNVFQGALPFVGIIALGLIILILFPTISTVFID